MFDPTIYENLKIILEGMVYDLDFDGQLKVTNRSDIVDLAALSRTYSLEVLLKENNARGLKAKVELKAGLEDLADEIMERETENTGCRFSVTFYLTVQDIERECSEIGEILRTIWKPIGEISQKVSYIYGMPRGSYSNEVLVLLNHKLHDENSGQLEEYLDRMMASYEQIFNKGEN
ncbi:hypothetical protein [Fictibacillus terranigra]|uniref:Uncharacterized protein n=1 Tax=Fictibacillus terranigra TaxID=3058424 RepID=A0ABT8E9D1_9BACL|nr:hypothetical protein [Fictibacillus sp. CENA-BCM004]MDN4074518.1 hypothetical protein [Fictibacillus sp. CENA-BCM004]